MSDDSNKKKYYQTEEFLSLNSEWKKKLKESDFHDIERGSDEYGPKFEYININSPETALALIRRDQLYEYQSMVSSYLNTGNFKNRLERSVLELHLEGLTVRGIGSKLGKSSSAIQYQLTKVLKRMRSGIE